MRDDPGHPPAVRVGREPAAPGGPDPAARSSVAIGFGSPANDSGVTRLDLNDVLVRHAQATFLMRVAGSAMREAGIDDGDLLLIDRAVVPAHGHIVVAVVGHEFVCRRLDLRAGRTPRLRASDPAVADLQAREGEGFELWGVVTTAIKSLPV